MKLTSRGARVGLIGLVLVTLVAAPACSRVERQNVDGVDCVVIKSPIGQPKDVDCDWPAEDRDQREESETPQ